MAGDLLGPRLGTIFIFWLFAGSVFAANPVILYPGSFDPFHKTHEQEVLRALETHPEAQLVILPIEHAQYTPRVAGTQLFLPKFLNYEARLQWIDQTFTFEPRVRSSNFLEELPDPILEEILEAVDHFEATHLLVGTDVVEKWATLGMLSEIVDHVQLIVTTDPKHPHLTQEMREWSSTSSVDWSRVEVLEGIPDGFRSVVVQKMIVRSENLSLYLPEAVVTALEQGDIDRSLILEEYVTQVTYYLAESFEQEMMSTISDHISSILSPELAEYIFEHDVLTQYLVATDMSHGLAVLEFEALLRATPEFMSLSALSRSRLQSTLARVFQNGEVRDWYEKQAHFISMLKEISAVALQTPTSPAERSFGAKLSYLAFRFLVGRAAEPLQKALTPFLGVRLPDQNSFQTPLLKLEDPEEYIEVYRGVRHSPYLHDYEQAWLKSGFLSKVALSHYLAGDTLEESIAKSEAHLAGQGVQNALIDHIFGRWKEHTSLISTTLDKRVATEFAGVGGRVYTLRVPIRNAIFSNDLHLWRGTPWEDTGNPSSKQQEVMVTHHIPSEQIINAETVMELSSEAPIMAASFLPAARNYSRYFALSAATRRFSAEPLTAPTVETCADLLR